MAAPLGNDYAAKGRRVEKMIERALLQEDDKRLRQGIESVLDKVADGDRWAIEFVTDRLDGKARQAVELSGEVNVGFHELLLEARERARG